VVNNISNMINTQLRFTGMASGLDTDYIIQQMMSIERLKVDRVKQDKQILEWKRDDYRSITNLLRGFMDEFFDILKPATNMRSSSTYYAYKVKSSNENIATAVTKGQVAMLEHTIEVTRLAEKAKMEAEKGKFGGVGLSLNSTIADIADVYDIDLTYDSSLGKNKLSLKVNGETIEITEDKKFSDLISAINNSDAGVKISYSSFLDQFFMESKDTGAVAEIDVTDDEETITADFFSALGFDVSQVVTGQDAEFVLDGQEATRNSNIFTIDGVTYTLTGTGEATITLTQDTDAIFNRIKNFIDKYNELIEKISGKVNEERPKSGGRYGSYYLPLTEDQKKAMTEDEIKKWEEQAKKGLLRNDSLLSNIVQRMRSVMGDVTEAGGLFSIGISTGNWREGAKLFIDEDKLRKAIEDNPDRVMEIFAKSSEISYSPDNTKELRDQRYKESGVIERLFDVLQDNIRTSRDKDGKKGFLLEKAGIVGDITEFKNTLVEQINDKELLIEDMTIKLYEKEESLYIKFAALEAALSRMNSQSAWLAQSFGGGRQ